ncbi:MAG TPA: hypothetical protein VN920_02515 [Pyrinomonadaceae bacterium]|nr:hypothetical protein [Pyrinomonadaceae bacterium]
MSLVVRAFPVLKEGELRQFPQEVSGTRSTETAEFLSPTRGDARDLASAGNLSRTLDHRVN